jgi:peptide/nickel transport system substrate-binding protein
MKRTPQPKIAPGRLTRRCFLVGTASCGAASALGRTPYGGRLVLKLPWPVDGLDPHALDDPLGALFSGAVADPLFALDARGRPYPTLAAGLPQRIRGGTRVALRPLLVTARGRPLDARDLLWSIKRSRSRAGAATLARYPEPTADTRDGLAVRFTGVGPDELARALSSPVTALLPRGFSRLRPDGTGAFLAEPSRDALELRRNARASRGASYLDSIRVTRAADLADALRSFEVGDVDLGWLGRGLHRPRPGAVAFDAGRMGWVILRTGRDARDWGAPGVAQQLADSISAASVAHLGLHGLPAKSSGSRWGGPACELLVAADAPHLIEIARSVAAQLARPGHAVQHRPRPRRELSRRRARASFSLMLDFVRPIGPTAADSALALLTAGNPALLRQPPQLGTAELRRVAQTLQLGVVGELRIEGARIRPLQQLESWNLGAVWRK